MTTKPKKTMLSSKEEEKIKRSIVQAIINNAIEKGDIDPRNKSKSELEQEISNFLKSLTTGNTEFQFVIDHRENLLAEARRYVESDNNELGCLFYAVWFEHWINALIANLGYRKKLQEKETILIIRELSFHGKLALIPTLFELPKLNKNYVDTMLKVAEIRNGFIHYKWQGKSEQVENQQKDELDKLIQNIGKVVKYLKSYEARHLYHGQKKMLRKINREK
jgi:hypothetical protein